MTTPPNLDLRRRAWLALGWDVIEPEFYENDIQRINGIGRPPGSATTQLLPAIESDPAVSEPMFLEWITQMNFAWEMTCNSPGSVWLDVADSETRLNDSCVHIRVHGSTPSEVRALAIIAAQEKGQS